MAVVSARCGILMVRLPNEGNTMLLHQGQQLFRRFATTCATDKIFSRIRTCATTSSNLFHEAHLVSSVNIPTTTRVQECRHMYTGPANSNQAWQRKLQISVTGLPPIRGYSSDSGDGKDRRLEELKGFIMYVPNPTTWLKMQWQTLQLRRKYDPGFSMTEFLKGAKQALCHVTHLLSREDFDNMENLVSHQVAVWLKGHIATWSLNERESISLAPEEIVVMRARGSKLVEVEEEKILYIDTICFALKRDMSSMKPMLIDIGFRFMRNYGTEPPSDWIIGGVTHLRFQLLTG